MIYQQTTGHISTLDGQWFKAGVPSFKIDFVVTVGDGIPGLTISQKGDF